MSNINSDEIYVFPNNVNTDSKIRAGDRDYLKIGMVIFFIANTFMFVMGISLANQNNWPLWLPIVIIIILNLILLTLILRFGVFNEASLEKEHKEQESSNFNRYCKVQGIAPIKYSEDMGFSIPIYQYSDGSVFSLIKLTHGTNNARKTAGNEEVVTQLYRQCYREQLNISTYVGTEVFENSPEAKARLKKVASCEDPALANTVSRLYKSVYDISSQESNVECIYILLKARSEAFVNNIGITITGLLNNLNTIDNSFRPLHICDEDEFINFLKRYNSLGGIDTAKIKIDNLEEEGFSFSEIRIYRVDYENGDSKINNRIIETQLKSLKRMN